MHYLSIVTPLFLGIASFLLYRKYRDPVLCVSSIGFSMLLISVLYVWAIPATSLEDFQANQRVYTGIAYAGQLGSFLGSLLLLVFAVRRRN